MAIDDNTQYSLSGAQVKDLANKVKNSGVKTLTTDDYNWNSATGDETTPFDSIAVWMLPTGLYKVEGDSINILLDGTTGAAQTNGDTFVIVDRHGNWDDNSKEALLYVMTHRYGGGALRPLIISAMYYGNRWHFNPSYRAATNKDADILLGKDIVDNLTTKDGTGGSRNGRYAALSAYQGYLLNQKIEGRVVQNAGAPTTSTVGAVGMLLEDTTNGKLYICTAIVPGTDPDPDTYTWEEVGAGGGSGPTVVQTIGTSSTDVMSQDAVSKMVYADVSGTTGNGIKIGYNTTINSGGNKGVAIGNSANGSGSNAVAIGNTSTAKGTSSVSIGTYSSTGNSNYAVAVGPSASASATNAVAIGFGTNIAGNYGVAIGSNTANVPYAAVSIGYNIDSHSSDGVAIGHSASTANSTSGAIALGTKASATRSGEMNIGSVGDTNFGFNNTEYRLLSGVHDPVGAHDAATKGYVDTLVPSNVPTITMTSTDPGEGGALAANNFIAVYDAS